MQHYPTLKLLLDLRRSGKCAPLRVRDTRYASAIDVTNRVAPHETDSLHESIANVFVRNGQAINY